MRRGKGDRTDESIALRARSGPGWEPGPSPESPDWVRDAVLRTWDEARLFAQAALRFTTRPGRFAR